MSVIRNRQVTWWSNLIKRAWFLSKITAQLCLIWGVCGWKVKGESTHAGEEMLFQQSHLGPLEPPQTASPSHKESHTQAVFHWKNSVLLIYPERGFTSLICIAQPQHNNGHFKGTTVIILIRCNTLGNPVMLPLMQTNWRKPANQTPLQIKHFSHMALTLPRFPWNGND